MPHISFLTQAIEQVIENIEPELVNVSDYCRKSFNRLDELTETEPIIGDKRTIKSRNH